MWSVCPNQEGVQRRKVQGAVDRHEEGGEDVGVVLGPQGPEAGGSPDRNDGPVKGLVPETARGGSRLAHDVLDRDAAVDKVRAVRHGKGVAGGGGPVKADERDPVFAGRFHAEVEGGGTADGLHVVVGADGRVHLPVEGKAGRGADEGVAGRRAHRGGYVHKSPRWLAGRAGGRWEGCSLEREA